MRVALSWVIAAILGALVWRIPMTFLMQRPKVWTTGPHFGQDLMLWLAMGAAWGCYMRYMGLRRARRNV
jgi:hypothetical protein